jgi:hemerythrin-like domain-containing protein
MSSLVSIWRAEHRAFGALLGLLEQQVELLQKGEAPNYEMMLDVVSYMVDYADRFHHPAEDRVFAKLSERVPATSDNVRELGRQHSEILKNGRELTSGLEGAMNGAVTLRSAIENQAKRYLDTFRQHMYTEEQGLFLAALEHLSEEDWRTIEREAQRGEDPLFGERPDQRYRALRQEISGLSR